MKILVLSDSHSTLHAMRRYVKETQPNVIVHLGDHYDDAQVLAQENPEIIVHQVAGNCDRYRCPPGAREMLCYPLGCVMTFMTHGHNQHVKMGIGALLADARRYDAKLVLFGHTHVPFCKQEPDGLWILNPGSCGGGAGTAGLVYVEDGKIIQCQILKP